MSEYIERDAANYALRECVRAYPNSFYNGIEVARSAIIKLPAADVRPVARGAWRGIGKTCRIFVCSACDKTFPYKTNFCPNCGARMEES